MAQNTYKREVIYLRRKCTISKRITLILGNRDALFYQIPKSKMARKKRTKIKIEAQVARI
jgi:hypothetical protein